MNVAYAEIHMQFNGVIQTDCIAVEIKDLRLFHLFAFHQDGLIDFCRVFPELD